MVSDTEAASLVAKISAKGVGAFKRKVSSAEREVDSLSRSVEDAGDEMTTTAAQTTAATGAMTSYSGATTSAALASGGLSTALTASLIPAAAALSTTLGPLVATFGALAAGAASLAGAFTTVIGTGFLAFGDKLASQNKEQLRQVRQRIRGLERLQDTEEGLTQTQREQLRTLEQQEDKLSDATSAAGALALRFKKLKDRIVEILIPLGQQFIPLIEDGINALPRLVQRMVDSVGSLTAFRDELRRLGGIAMDVIPAMTGAMFDFARRVLPIFRNLVNFLRARTGPTFAYLSSVVDRTGPAFAQLGGAAIDVLRPLTELGVTVTRFLAPRLAGLIDLLGDAVRWFNGLPRPVQRVAIAVGLLAPAVVAAVTALAGIVSAATAVAGVLSGLSPVLLGLVGVAGVVGGALTLLGTDFDGLRQTAVNAVSRIARRVPELFNQLVDLVRPLLFRLERDFREVFGQIRVTASNLMEAVKRQVLRPARSMQTEFGQNINAMRAEAKQTFETIRSIITRVLDVLLSNYRQHWTKVLSLFRRNLSGSNGILANARTAFNALWNNIIQPTLNLIQAGWRVFGDDLIRILDGALGTILTVARIGMDAVLTAINVALDLISGDWEGAWTNIKNFLQRTWRTITEWLNGSGKQLLVGAFNIIIKAAKGVFNAFYNWIIGGSFFPDLIRDVTSYLRGAGRSAIDSAFGDIVGAIENTLNGIDLSGISDAINGIIDTAEDAISRIADIPETKTTTVTVEREFDTDEDGRTDHRPNDDVDDDDDDDEDHDTDVSPPTHHDPGDDDDDGGGGLSDDDERNVREGLGLQSGGLTKASGMAMLHKNEVVMGVDAGAKALADRLDGGDTFVINVSANSRAEGREAGRGVADALRSEGIGR